MRIPVPSVSVLSLVVAAQLAIIATAIAEPSGDPARGLAYAKQVCSECHAIEPGRRSPNPDSPPFDAIANTPGISAIALQVFFQTPHATMPNLIIPNSDQDDLIAYLLKLREQK